MLSYEYRFPLIDELLYGALNPFLSSNSCEAFLLQEEPHLSVQAKADSGIFAISFVKPPNLKCSFYYHRLPAETIVYCNDLREEFSKITDTDISAYLKLTILDRHLKTALIKTGNLIREYKLSIADFLTPTPDTDIEKTSNSYIIHLLKVCLAKAWLEIQSILEPSSARQVNETYLYTGFAGEAPPVRNWLRRRESSEFVEPAPKPIPVEKKSEFVSEEISSAQSEKFYSLKDLQEMGYGSERTLRRRLVAGELNGFKNGSKWLVEKNELNRYIADLKAKTKNHNK